MKTEKMLINSKGLGMSEALEAVEKMGLESNLERKELIHLRLLAEELVGLMRGKYS